MVYFNQLWNSFENVKFKQCLYLLVKILGHEIFHVTMSFHVIGWAWGLYEGNQSMENGCLSSVKLCLQCGGDWKEKTGTVLKLQ